MASRRMKTSPMMACLKTLLTIFNFIFLVIGLGILVVGVLTKTKFESYLTLSTIDYSNAPWAMIAIGSFIFIVGIMGCCATLKGNTCLLRTYGLLLAIVFICELAGAIMAIVFKGKVDVGFQDGMTIAVQNYTQPEYKEAVDNAQKDLKCCGVNNYTDWWKLETYQLNTVPASCCSNKTWCDSNLYKNDTNIVDISSIAGGDVTVAIYDTGCHKKMFDIVKENLAIIIGVMFGVAFFQVIGMILACWLASNINTNKYELV
ncbi:tetraspanin-7-like [Styela clava]|uniref:tetraspanin-7-like n=1 Tax=Styela clava TaxID=7725 RepID=UPI0019398E05|nr:tetraspanin-7-like [Styela clava]